MDTDRAPMDRAQAHAELDKLLDELNGFDAKANEYSAAGVSDAATGLAMMHLIAGATFAANLCGPAIVSAAYGERDARDRGEDLRLLSRRLLIASHLYPFEQLDQDPRQGSVASAYNEVAAISCGDDPSLFAKLSSRKIRARVIWQKKNALIWEAYLAGLGIDLTERRTLLMTAFGAQWDTMSRWGEEVDKLQGDGTVAKAIEDARKDGIAASRLPDQLQQLCMMIDRPALPWREELAADGRRYREAVGFRVVG